MMLALDGTAVPLLYQPIAGETREFGDTESAHDGTLMTRVRARKQSWQCVTRFLTTAEAATLRAVLVSAPPVAATGDLTGSLSVVIQDIREQVTSIAGLERRKAFTFTMREA